MNWCWFYPVKYVWYTIKSWPGNWLWRTWIKGFYQLILLFVIYTLFFSCLACHGQSHTHQRHKHYISIPLEVQALFLCTTSCFLFFVDPCHLIQSIYTPDILRICLWICEAVKSFCVPSVLVRTKLSILRRMKCRQIVYNSIIFPKKTQAEAHT